MEETAWETASWSLAQDAQLAALVQLIATKKARSPTTLKADDFATVEPMQMLRFELLQPVAADALHARCVVLCELSAAVADHLLPWVDLSASGAAGSLAHELCALKPLIFSKAKERFWAKLKETTKKEGNQPRLRFDRHKANRAVEAREAAAAAGGKGAGGGGGGAAAARLGSDAAVGGAAAESTLFEQLLEQIDGLSSSGFRRAAATSGDGEHRGIDVSMLASSEKAFSVSFVSEAGQDAGGPYRETLDNLCAELHSAALPLLVHTPNATQLNALDRDKRMLNPAARSAAALRQFELMGALIGIALRTNAPLAFELSGYTWKLLLGEAPNVGDLARIDRDTASLLVRVRDNKDPNSPDMSPEMFDGVYSWMDFTFTRSDGLESRRAQARRRSSSFRSPTATSGARSSRRAAAPSAPRRWRRCAAGWRSSCRRRRSRSSPPRSSRGWCAASRTGRSTTCASTRSSAGVSRSRRRRCSTCGRRSPT